MEYRELGRTGVKVSAITLGTMTWGEQNTEDEGHAQMDYALDQGINLFDAAEMYPIPPKAATAGATEEIIGTWLASRKARDKVMIASKVSGRSSAIDWLRDEPMLTRQTPAQMREAIDKSLQRLNTDYLDLYQLHWPDRPIRVFEGLEFHRFDDDAHNIHEILEVLGEFVTSGKVRFIGLSNETPWGVMTFLKLAEQHGLPRVVSIQNAFSLVNRAFEVGLSEVAYEEQVGLLGYSPLGQGYLSGKYENGALPEGARKTLFNRLGRYEYGNGPKAISAYVALAQRHGLDPSQMAISYALSRPFMTSVIIGATTMAQLKTDIDAQALTLSEAVLEEIDQIHLDYPNPCP
ncbi:MAG: NADP(H)-dependent aldo-keto reductase [Pseudomonadota bacterium]